MLGGPGPGRGGLHFDIHATAVAALKSRLTGTGVATSPEVDAIERPSPGRVRRRRLAPSAGAVGWRTTPSSST
jgi:hypothetical protein